MVGEKAGLRGLMTCDICACYSSTKNDMFFRKAQPEILGIFQRVSGCWRFRPSNIDPHSSRVKTWLKLVKNMAIFFDHLPIDTGDFPALACPSYVGVYQVGSFLGDFYLMILVIWILNDRWIDSRSLDICDSQIPHWHALDLWIYVMTGEKKHCLSHVLPQTNTKHLKLV